MQITRLDTFSGHKGPIYALEQGMSSHLFYSAGSDGWVVQWNLEKPDLGHVIAQIKGSCYAMRLDRENNALWIAENFMGIHVVNLLDPKEIFSIKLENLSIFDIQWVGSNVWVAHDHGMISIIDPGSRQVIKHLKTSIKSVRKICLLNKKRVALGYSDGFIRIFNENQELIFAWKSHQNSVFSMVFDEQNSTLISVGRDAFIRKWQLDNHLTSVTELLAVPGHVYTINDVVYHPNQALLATASMDKTIKIWRTDDLALLKVIDFARYGSHKNSVNRLIWSNFEDILVSASDDKNISIWKIDSSF